MNAQRLAAVLIVGAVLVGTGAGVLLYTGGSDIGSNSQAGGSNSTGDDVTALNQSSDGMVYLDVAPSSDRDQANLSHALVGLYDEKSINVSSIELVDSQRDASTVAIATDGRSNATYIATWTERHLDQQANNADSGSSNHSEAASSQARCGVEPAYYQIDFVAGEPIENLQGPEGTYTPDELIRFAHGNSERSDIRRSSNGEFTTNESLRNAVDSQSISVENGTATVSFSIAEDSDPVELTLASYTKPQQVWTRATESEQEFVDADTRTFEPGGEYTLSVDLPNSKVVPCETDTESEQPDQSTETDTPESPGTTQASPPSGTSETTTSGTTTSDTTTSETTTPETTNPGTTEEPPTTTPPTETPAADLSVTKTVADANATVGDNVTFTVEVTNNGPDAASNVTVNEMLGSGLTFQSGEVSQGVYDPGTGVYSVGTLANGETATLGITATIESADNTTNAVEVTSDQPDPNSLNNNDSATPSPETADLSLTKNVNESAPNIGEDVEYTLTLTNDGPNATSNVTVADALPDGVSFVSSDASQGSYDNGTGLWTVNSLSDGGEATLAIVASVEGSDDVTNVAEINSSEMFDPDSTPNNNNPDEDDQDTVTVDGQEADLAVTKTVEDTGATVGDTVTFTVNVTNNGPDTATDVSVIESLNSGLSYQSAETTQGTYNEDTNVYEVGELENGETATLTLTALIESVENTSNAVAVTGEQPDPDPGDNTNTSDPSPNVADLNVVKTVNETNATVGDNVTFTVDVTNKGPDTATNVSVNESLESGLSFVDASATQGEYNVDTSTYDVGSLADGETATLTLTALIETAENTTNAVEVTGDEPDPNDPNDNDTADPSPTVADLSLTKSVSASTPNVGDTVEYTLELTNNGPNATSNVSVEDALPDGLTFVSADASQGSYDAGTGLWSVDSLAAGEESTLTVVTTVDSSENITNVAHVNASDVYDPDSTPDNDVPGEDDRDSVTIDGQQADIAVNKTVEDSNATVGDNVVFTIDVTNNGPDTATNVSAYETLDSGLSFVDASATQGEYNADTGVYSVGSLANNDTATLTLTATIESPNNTTNAVEVTSDTPDPNDPNNNETVDPSPTVSDLSINKTVDDTNATVGDTVDFTVGVTNNGPDEATNVSVNEDLGKGLSFVEADTTQGEYDADTGVYDVGTLANNDTATLTLTATIESAKNTTNAVNVTGDPFDPTDPNNNETVDPSPRVADLALDKSVNETSPDVGENVEYTLTLSNDGPNATSNVTVADALPAGLSFVSSDASQGSYDNASGLWTVNSISNSSEATLSVVATVESADDVTNIAEVNSSDTFDPNSTPNNNESDEDDQDSSTVNGQSADLAVSKTVNATDATVGDNATFTVDVTNNGPDTATNVSVTESLGDGFSFRSASTTQGSYDANTSVYTVGTLDSNETATLTLTARINSTDNTTNAVEVTSDQPDPNPPNNNDTANPTPAVADLSLTKNVNESAPDVGENVEYTLTLTNDGPNATSNVTVADALPDGVSYVSASASQGSYDNGTNLWTVNSIANDSEATLSVIATVESTDDITNVAEVNSSETFDPDSTPDNDNPDEDDRGSTTINGQSADLAVSKTVNDTNVTVGDTVAFTVEVTNNGPDAATNVAVDEALGTGLAFQSATVSQGSYDNGTNTYDVGTLASDETATLTLTATIESADDTANAAEVTSDTPDPNDPNNNETVDPSPSVADLALTKNVNESAPNVGDTIEYTLTLTNNGPNATANVTVADSLPDGLSGVSANASQGSYDTTSGLWTVGKLANGEQSTLTITATVQSTTDVTNVAEVNSSDTFDPNSTPNNNESGENDQGNATVNGQSADLAVTKSVDDSGATIGDNVTFTVDVTNTGPDTARNVVVDDALPAGLTFQSASATQGEYDESNGTYSVGDLEDGATATLTLTATIEETANLENVATGTSDTFDPDESNNKSSATPSPQVADLSLSKSVNESAPALGNNVEYTVTLSNAGPDTATNVTVTEPLPDGLEFVSSDAGQGSYDSASGLWTVSEVAGDDEATLTLVATVNTTDNATNMAEVNSSDQFDPNSTPGNDEPGEDDQDNATVNGQSADLAVNKTVEDVNATVGDDVTFTIDVTNNGPDTATNVSAYETLDSGLSFVDASATQGEYNADTGVYSVGSLANGDTATLTLTATIESPNNTTNAVEVTSETPDPNLPNNNETVDPSPIVSDLSINKTVDDTNATVGDDVTFTVDVTNEGPDTATNVSVNEDLGEGLSFVEADTTQGEYDADAGVYDVGTLGNGETATLTLTATIESPDNTTNAVNVTGDPFDPNDPNNNETVDPSPIVSDLSINKTVDETNATVGDTVDFTVGVTNNGPDTATNVSVNENLGEGLSFVEAETSQGDYDADTGVYDVGTLANGETATLTLTATIESADNTTNAVNVTGDPFDPNDPNNNETVDPSPIVSDLSVTKTVDDTNATVGDTVDFTVDVTNNGPDTATNVSVNENLGEGLSFVEADTTQGEYDADAGVYDVGTLGNGETATLTLTATIESPDNTTNAVNVTGDPFDPNDPNNNETVDPSPQVTDLNLTKSVNETNPNVGENVEYTLALTNDGPNESGSVEVTDVLPDGVTLVSSEASRGSYSGDTWSFGESTDGLPSSEIATLTVVATIDNAGTITNVAEITSSEYHDPDSTPDNDNASEDDQDSVEVSAQERTADLTVTKTVDDSEPTVGDDVTFTVDVTNDGPNTATNVAVNESLGDGLSFQSADVSQGEYDEGSNVYDVGTLDSGATATLTLTATIDSAENTTNAVDVTGDQPDPNPPNNNDSVTPTPTAADLSLNKTVNESAPQTGAGIAYTLTLTNDGPNATSEVAVGDTLPDGVTFVDANASQGTYNTETGVWGVGDVGDGETQTLTIEATVDTAGNQTNTAQVVSSSTSDPDSTPGNDDDGEDDQDSVTTQTTTPQCSIQLSNVTAPDSVDQGQSANIMADVTNTGLANDCGATATLNATGNSTRAVDIVFLMDTSRSTGPYIDQIANQLDGFASDLDAQGIDARYAVVSYGGGGGGIYGDGYVNIDQRYTSDSGQAVAALNSLVSDGGTERNYEAIKTALNQLNPRENANTFLIDVTDEDSDTPGDAGVPSGDPSQSEIANQIDSAGATFIAVSPTEDELVAPEDAGYNPDQDIRVLANKTRNGHWVNLFTDSGDLNNFVEGFQDIVVNRVEQGINRETSVTLDGGASDTLSFTVDTSSFTAGSELDYTVTVGGDTQTGTITITGSGSSSTTTSVASVADSSATANTTSQDTANETTAPPEMTESSSENASNTTATQTSTTEPSTETETETSTDEPTETVTTTETATETTTETTETPTESSTETTEPAPTTENTTAEASSSTTTETPTTTETADTSTEAPTETPETTTTVNTTAEASSNTTNETSLSTANATSEVTGNTETETPTEMPSGTTETVTAMENTTTAAPTTEPPTATSEAAETSAGTENTTAAP